MKILVGILVNFTVGLLQMWDCQIHSLKHKTKKKTLSDRQNQMLPVTHQSTAHKYTRTRTQLHCIKCYPCNSQIFNKLTTFTL